MAEFNLPLKTKSDIEKYIGHLYDGKYKVDCYNEPFKVIISFANIRFYNINKKREIKIIISAINWLLPLWTIATWKTYKEKRKHKCLIKIKKGSK